jgi:hypothetical protein
MEKTEDPYVVPCFVHISVPSTPDTYFTTKFGHEIIFCLHVSPVNSTLRSTLLAMRGQLTLPLDLRIIPHDKAGHQLLWKGIPRFELCPCSSHGAGRITGYLRSRKTHLRVSGTSQGATELDTA